MLLDTAGLVCYFDRNDDRQADAETLFEAAPTKLTHNYVLAEFVAVCHTRNLNRTGALSFVTDLLGNSTVEIVWVDETLHRNALSLLQSQLDKTYSLGDAVSFVLMQQRSISEALTTDITFSKPVFGGC